MPKALKAHPGERLDLVDYVQGANTYTQETQKFSTEREWLDRRSRILDGFRIRVEDQATYPGLITVFNGDALDRTGQLINNEESFNDSRSLTLLGANLTFYVEIEFTAVESDTDARYFWDPTIPNTPPEPDGSEFSVNVATRLSPDWRVVTPVSTTGFQQTSNPNSIRIPVGVFRTDGGNQISAGIDNPGLSLVRPASVLETDIAVGVSQIRVVDTRVFPAVPFNITLDVGGAAPEARTVSAIDRDNGILTLGVATGFAHSAGAIVRVTSANFDMVQQRTDPNFPAFDPAAVFPTHPDPTQKMWQGDEVRGSALVQSKEAFGDRDDLNVRSLKDEIDFLAAQIREMKFGHPRPEVKSAAPPSVFGSRLRYFDRAGSIQGAKSNTVSIGNGTTTFGDFNGSDENVFIAAIAALPATGGVIYVKGATYGFNNTVFIGKPVVFVGEGLSTVIVNNVVAGPAFSTSAKVVFQNLVLSRTLGLGVAVDITGSIFVDFINCQVNTGIRLNGSVNAGIRAYKTLFMVNTAVPVVTETGGGTLIQSEFRDCYLVTTSIAISCPVNNVLISNCYILAASLFLTGGASDDIQKLKVENNQIFVSSNLFISFGTQVVVDVSFVNNQITVSNLAASGAVMALDSTVAAQGFSARNNSFVISATTSTDVNPSFVLATFANTSIALLSFEQNAVICPSGGYIIGYGSDVTSTSTPVVISNNTFVNSAEMVRLGSSLNQMTSGHYEIVDNFHDNAGNTSIAYGVRLFDKPTVSFVRVSRNSFLNYDNAGAGDRYGVDCTWDYASTTVAPQILIDHNYFDNFAGSGSTAAVFFDSIATAPGGGMVKVFGNRICRINSDGGAFAAGVYLNPVLGNAQISFQVADNNIFYIGSGVIPRPVNAFGIYCSGTNILEVDNNYIHRVSTSDVTGIAASIYLLSCGSPTVSRSQVLVSNNSCAWATGASAAATPAGGRLIHVQGNSYFVKISGNVCSQKGTTGASGKQGILVYSDLCRSITISDNTILSTSDSFDVGIAVERVSTASLIQDVLIANNLIEISGTTLGTGVGIRSVLGGPSSGLVVSGNVIREYVLTNTRVGISVSGSNNTSKTRNVVINNNVVTSTKSGVVSSARIGIYLANCEFSTVSNNHIDWLQTGLANGNGIYLTESLGDTWLQFCVVGNFITPCAAALINEIEITNTAVLDGLLSSNIVGNSVVTGSITPAAGNWSYFANKTS